MALTTTGELVRQLGGRLERGVPDRILTALSTPEAASAAHVAVIFGKKATERARATRADVLVCSDQLEVPESCRADLIRVADAQRAFVSLIRLFHPRASADAGVHPRAIVDPSAHLGEGVVVGAGAVVEAGAQVGNNSVLSAQSYVGRGTRLGADCVLEVGARVLENCLLGVGVLVGPGSVIGSRGFGYLPPDAKGHREAIPQVGTVEVGDGAEIGALCAVDRGTLGATRIGASARLDNLVQVGHNAQVAEGAILVAQVGISGSSRIGRGAVLAGQSGVADHRSVGDGAVLLARAAAFRDVPAGAVYGGVPARPKNQWLAERATLSRLSRRGRDGEPQQEQDEADD